MAMENDPKTLVSTEWLSEHLKNPDLRVFDASWYLPDMKRDARAEYDAGHIPDITLIPMSELQERVSEIPTDVEVILTCRSGNRSGQVHAYLSELGYDNVHNMEGGILAWEAAGYDVEQ